MGPGRPASGGLERMGLKARGWLLRLGRRGRIAERAQEGGLGGWDLARRYLDCKKREMGPARRGPLRPQLGETGHIARRIPVQCGAFLCVIQGHLTENVKSQHGQVRECPGMRHLCGAEAKSETLRAVPRGGPGYIFGEKGRIAPSDHQL